MLVAARASGGRGPEDADRPLKGRCVVGRLSEFPPGTRKIVTFGGRSIGVFNIGGQFYALRNQCPHQGAPLCRGRVKGTTIPGKPYEYVYGRDQEIIQCPWHGWEFEITTGRTFFNPHRMRVKTYEVTVEPDGEGDVTLETFEVTTEGELVILHA
jgi:nitrite reductase (NADH) small subunit